MESPAERDLIARMTRQEPEALRDFQAAYTPLLRYIIAPILPDPRDQEECLADAVHRAWERIGQFDRTGGSFSGWLSVLARNTAVPSGRAWTAAASSSTPPPPRNRLCSKRSGYRLWSGQ